MTLKNLYDAIGASYDDTIERLMSADFLLRFVRKFPDDPSFAALKDALARGSTEEAFRAAHTLKGVCGNLGLGGLQRSAGELTEMLRRRARPIPAEARPLLEAVERDYERTAAAIGTFLEER